MEKPRATGTPVLDVRNASISYFTRAGAINVVPDISFVLQQGEALGLVGESGCGKSTVAFAVMNYLGGSGRLTGGEILFEGRNMATMSGRDLRAIRGGRMAMVYQDPMSSLNPVMPVGRQLMEVPIVHQGASEADARQRALSMLAEVNLPDPDWGGMVKETYAYLSSDPHMALIPCAAISSLVVGFNLLADGLREISLRD